MATERITIVVEERGARTVQRSIEGLAPAADRARSSIDGLKAAMAALGVVAALRGLVSLLDTFTNLQNRIRQLTTGTTQLAVVTNDLLAVANRTRGSFQGTVDLYFALGNAARDLGASQAEIIRTTETLNQLVALSGASSQAAAAALAQLGQGLASGTLRGQELNSILEQLPNVADVIARSLGVTRGELRKMGEDGKITAGVVLRAFAEARAEVAERFARSVPTIGQAFVVLKNQLIAFAGSFDTATGASRTFSSLVLSLAANFDTLARAAISLGLAIATVLVGRGINAAIIGLRALTAAALANPFTALAAVILLVTTSLITFSDQITIATGSTTTLGDLAVAVWERIKAGLQVLGAAISSILAPLAPLFQRVFGDVEISFLGLLRAAANVIDNIIGFFTGAYRAIVAAFQGLPGAIGDLFARAFNGAIELVEGFVNRTIRAINAIGGVAGVTLLDPVALGRLENRAQGAAASIGGAISEGFRSGFDERGTTAFLEGVIGRADALAGERAGRQALQAQQEAAARAELERAGTNNTRPPAADGNGGRRQRRQVTFAELLADLEGENAVLRANREEREALTTVLQFEDRLRRQLTATERTQVLTLARQNVELQRLNQLYEDVAGPALKLEDRQRDLNTLFEQGRISVAQYTQEMRSLNVALTALDNTFAGGVENAFARLAERANDLGSGISDVIVGAFDDATEAVVEFARTGQVNIRQFVQDVSAQFLKLATQQLIAQGLGALAGAAGGAGGAEGGVFSLGKLLAGSGGGGGSKLPGFATGGGFTVGGSGGTDSQLVAFRATPGESVDVRTPSQQQEGAAPAPQQPIRIVNVVDPREAMAALNTAEGERIIINMIERNPNTVRRILGGG